MIVYSRNLNLLRLCNNNKRACFPFCEQQRFSSNLASMGFRLPCQRGLYQNTVHTTSLSLPVNYLRIRYRLPTRRNSTRQTEKKTEAERKEWEREKRKVSRDDQSRRATPRRRISAALKGHLMLSEDHLQSPTFAFVQVLDTHSTAGAKQLSS